MIFDPSLLMLLLFDIRLTRDPDVVIFYFASRLILIYIFGYVLEMIWLMCNVFGS